MEGGGDRERGREGVRGDRESEREGGRWGARQKLWYCARARARPRERERERESVCVFLHFGSISLITMW